MPPISLQSWNYLRWSSSREVIRLQHIQSCFSSTSRGRGSKGTRWSKDELDILTRLKTNHRPTSELLAMLPGRTKDAIFSKWRGDIGPRDEHGKLLHLHPRHVSQQELESITSLRQSGLSYAQIAKQHPIKRPVETLAKVYRGHVNNVRSSHNNWRQWDQAEIDRMVHMHEVKGYTADQIAAALGRTKFAVLRKISLNKIARGFPKEGGKRFTAEEDAAILRISEGSNVSPADFENVLPGRSYHSIRNRLKYWHRQCGIPRRTPLQVAKLSQRAAFLSDQGLSSDKIGKELGISSKYARLLVRREKGATIAVPNGDVCTATPTKN